MHAFYEHMRRYVCTYKQCQYNITLETLQACVGSPSAPDPNYGEIVQY